MPVRLTLIFILLLTLAPQVEARCDRLPEGASTAPSLSWRQDFPAEAAAGAHAWDAIDPTKDWQGYMAAVLAEIRQSGIAITGGKIDLATSQPWWVMPWLDYGRNGREKLLGLTRSRILEAKALSPSSREGLEAWSLAFYNAEAAQSLGRIFADQCEPMVPVPVAGKPWNFAFGSMAFNLVFSDAGPEDAPWLQGAPEVLAAVGEGGAPEALRLIELDFMVRDTRALATQWVMGSFTWRGPPRGDGFLDNLVPMGLSWGNGAAENALSAEHQAGQAHLNGVIDNKRSGCISCHGLSQWQRHRTMGLAPGAETPEAEIASYFVDIKGGDLHDPGMIAKPLDYSLGVEAALSRMCRACADEVMTGKTPDICRIVGPSQIMRGSCEKSTQDTFVSWLSGLFAEEEPETPPRQ